MTIDWQPWGEAAFQRARDENKPVLLSIGAVWCHWCHVMDRTTYSDERVIEHVNAKFVAIRVDNDERPDINMRYNMGGWPTTAFLSHDGSILTGATYMPPAQMVGVLDEIADFYANNREDIERRTAELLAANRRHTPAPTEALNGSAIGEIVSTLEASYDAEYGGFGEEPKFPQPDALDFLLVQWRLGGDAALYEMVARTMREMSRGGMYDHVEGGFFRYSTTRDWSVPHFEKMAEDHAGLLRVLAQLLLWARAHDLRPTLLSAIGWVRTALRDPHTGLFGGSQDADEAYYALPLEERRAMQAPFIDRRSFTQWTADLASAFCWASLALDDETLLAEACAALDAIDARLHDDDGLLYHVLAPGKEPAIRGLFADQAAYVRALIDAYEAGGEWRFLERAKAHAQRTVRAFAAPDGGFYDHRSVDAIGRLQLPDRPIVDNGRFAETLLRLAALSGDDAYRRDAERALQLYANTFSRAGAFGATYARALSRYLREPVVLSVGADMAEAAELREAARRLPTPFVDVLTVDGTSAHLCAGTRCGEPFESAADLRARYDALH